MKIKDLRIAEDALGSAWGKKFGTQSHVKCNPLKGLTIEEGVEERRWVSKGWIWIKIWGAFQFHLAGNKPGELIASNWLDPLTIQSLIMVMVKWTPHRLKFWLWLIEWMEWEKEKERAKKKSHTFLSSSFYNLKACGYKGPASLFNLLKLPSFKVFKKIYSFEKKYIHKQNPQRLSSSQP